MLLTKLILKKLCIICHNNNRINLKLKIIEIHFSSVTCNELFEYDLLIDNFGFENIMIAIGVPSLIQTKKDSFGNTEKLFGAL